MEMICLNFNYQGYNNYKIEFHKNTFYAQVYG